MIWTIRRGARSWRRGFLLTALTWVAAAPLCHAESTRADLVLVNARIYTANSTAPEADTLAIRGSTLLYVGPRAGARPFIGPQTRMRDLHHARVLPGLIDSHLHPIGMIKVDGCDLDRQPRTLRELSRFASDCLARRPVPDGDWLSILQWNPYGGNDPDPEYPTLRAALDKVSTRIAIQLIGTDGHHGAFNSNALARARNARGEAVGFSRATLASDFSNLREFIGVDADGEPDGGVNEAAKALMQGPGILSVNRDPAIEARAQLPRLLNAAGITGILDAKLSPDLLPLYDLLDRDGKLTFRAHFAQFYSPEAYQRPDGTVDYATLLKTAEAMRDRYAHHPKLRADTIKLFTDGVLEGDPHAIPPTLPNSAALHPYLQPIFAQDGGGKLTVSGYVDPESPACREAAAARTTHAEGDWRRAFSASHGFHPDQCLTSSGRLAHERPVIMEYVDRFHRAGFALHIHAIGDGGVAAALDALEAARAADEIATQRDALAHVQLAAPADIARIGRDHLYVAFTYSWAYADPGYDMTVVPFFDHVLGSSAAALHPADGYYERNAFPFKAVKQAGGILLGGSDAPVETRDPRPFVNMAMATTRRLPGKPAQNPSQAIGIRDAIDAYTIQGARFLGRETETGSLEAGKSADFIVVDRDILALGDSGRGDEIAGTTVRETWFMGQRVYVRGGARNLP